MGNPFIDAVAETVERLRDEGKTDEEIAALAAAAGQDESEAVTKARVAITRSAPPPSRQPSGLEGSEHRADERAWGTFADTKIEKRADRVMSDAKLGYLPRIERGGEPVGLLVEGLQGLEEREARRHPVAKSAEPRRGLFADVVHGLTSTPFDR